MTNNEIQLLNLIRDNDNTEQALVTAIEIICLYLNRPESFELALSVDSQEFV